MTAFAARSFRRSQSNRSGFETGLSPQLVDIAPMSQSNRSGFETKTPANESIQAYSGLNPTVVVLKLRSKTKRTSAKHRLNPTVVVLKRSTEGAQDFICIASQSNRSGFETKYKSWLRARTASSQSNRSGFETAYIARLQLCLYSSQSNRSGFETRGGHPECAPTCRSQSNRSGFETPFPSAPRPPRVRLNPTVVVLKQCQVEKD